jgi:hypothetical protein
MMQQAGVLSAHGLGPRDLIDVFPRDDAGCQLDLDCDARTLELVNKLREHTTHNFGRGLTVLAPVAVERGLYARSGSWASI